MRGSYRAPGGEVNQSTTFEGMAITPDDKDWTWVLDRLCGECGFDASVFAVETMPRYVIALANSWWRVLHRSNVRQRPSPDRWSALEYACHVRDVFRVFDQRLEAMMSLDGAQFENWDQDITAIDDRYHLQDPEAVAQEVLETGAQLATHFSRVQGSFWMHRGFRSNGSEFTVETLAKYLAHDPKHHLWDVGSDFVDTPSRHANVDGSKRG